MTQDEIKHGLLQVCKVEGWDGDFNIVGFHALCDKLKQLGADEEREKSLKLWMLLDDIDTADDIAKTDHDTYRRLCRNTQQKRWAVLNESEVDAAIRARGQA